MKILLVTQYFYPEDFKSNDIAFELKKRGHEVTVLTGIPNYPSGKINKGYGFFKNTKQDINGVKVIRAWLIPRGNGGGIRLFLNYFSFAFFASIKAFFHSLNNKYDAIIVHEPSPIMQFYPAWVVNFLRRTPIYFWVLDLWPETLEYIGGVKNKLVLKIFEKMVISFYNRSEKILLSSKGFEKSVLEKGNYKSKIIHFPNWAEDTISNGRIDLPIPPMPNGFKIMFAGNIGECQDMDNVMKAALELKNKQDIKWILVGDGRKMSFVKNFVRENNLQNTVYTLGRYPIETMASFFNQADFMLVSLRDDAVFNITVPAKIQAYMSAWKPIMGMLNGEGARNIEEAGCGYSVPAGDYKSLADKVVELSSRSREELNKLGNNGREYYLKNYSLDKCITHLETILMKKV